MGRRHDIDARIGALGDIAKIVRAMCNLSYLEMRKLIRFIEGQRRVVTGIDEAAVDFLDHHAALLLSLPDAPVVYVLIGAVECPFCGNFNEAVLNALTTRAGIHEDARLLAVGARLTPMLAGDPRLVDRIAGASVAEEIPGVLSALVARLDHLTAALGPINMFVLHWDAASDSVATVGVLPPFRKDGIARSPRHALASRLNLAPARFFGLLVEHYLSAVLPALLYSSLLAEHQRRIDQLKRALGCINERIGALAMTRNTLRQEETTEEIELILLNLDNCGEPYATATSADVP